MTIASTISLIANSSFSGTSGNDTFNGTYGDGGAGSFWNDTIAGNGGTDTLNLTEGSGAIAPTDALWAHVSGIDNVVFTTAGAGAQTFDTGANFENAFTTGGVAGVNLTANINGAGVIDIDMSGTVAGDVLFTGAAVIAATAIGAGAQTILTGSGDASVTASNDAGNQIISGTGLASVTAIDAGAGFQDIGNVTGGVINGGEHLVSVTATNDAGEQTIISTSNHDVTVNATDNGAGDQTIMATGTGNNHIMATTISGTQTVTVGNGNNTVIVSNSTLADVQQVTVGSGNNNITLTADHTGADSLTFSAPNGGSATSFTTITHLAASDTINFAGTFATVVVGALTGDLTVAGFVSHAQSSYDAGTGTEAFQETIGTGPSANSYVYQATGTTAHDTLIDLVGVHTVTASLSHVASVA